VTRRTSELEEQHGDNQTRSESYILQTRLWITRIAHLKLRWFHSLRNTSLLPAFKREHWVTGTCTRFER